MSPVDALLDGLTQERRAEFAQAFADGRIDLDGNVVETTETEPEAPRTVASNGAKRNGKPVPPKVKANRARDAESVYRALKASKIGREVIATADHPDYSNVLIGDWLWYGWKSKPDAKLTKYLYAQGFQFSGRRKAWYHTGGKQSRGHYRGNLRDRHTVAELD